jgi:hypothetical protein
VPLNIPITATNDTWLLFYAYILLGISASSPAATFPFDLFVVPFLSVAFSPAVSLPSLGFPVYS